MKRRRTWKRIGWTMAGVLVLLVLFAHPFFAITRPSGGRVLVAEGWMHYKGLEEAAELFRSGGYTHLYVTGTVRPFAYYLERSDAIELTFPAPVRRTIEVSAGGLPHAQWYLIGNGDTLLSEAATESATSRTIDLAGRSITTLRFSVGTDVAPGPGIPIGFIGALRVDGTDAHALASTITIHRADGRTEPGQPTHAEEARASLLANGVPDSLMTVVPTIDLTEGGRTASSARSFVAYAKAHGVGAFDVATLAVHARRTWHGYREANGGANGVGIIALYDPWCKRWTWWLNPYGWFQVLKEIVALPSTW